MSVFHFHPELFECRNEALEVLGEAGMQWMADFTSIDVLHDLFGVEVSGIGTEAEARQVLALLQAHFRGWRYGYVLLKDWSSRDAGWKAVVHRDPREQSGGCPFH